MDIRALTENTSQNGLGTGFETVNNLAKYITKDGDSFFFDAAEFLEEGAGQGIDYEDGDTVKWIWEGKRMFGVLRQAGYNVFTIKKVAVIE